MLLELFSTAVCLLLSWLWVDRLTEPITVPVTVTRCLDGRLTDCRGMVVVVVVWGEERGWQESCVDVWESVLGLAGFVASYASLLVISWRHQHTLQGIQYPMVANGFTMCVCGGGWCVCGGGGGRYHCR